MKIIWADRVAVGLYYDANFKWHMPIRGEICRAKQKYMPFFGTVAERAFRKKNPKRGTVTERVLREKNPERSIASFCICSHVLEFFSGKRAR